MRGRVSAAAAAVAAVLYLLYPLAGYDPVPALVLASASLAFGVIGSLVAARRLYFLAGAAPHSALLAALLAVAVHGAVGLPLEALLPVLGVLLVYTVGYTVFRGVDPDTATALYVSVTASLSVILVYIVKTRYPMAVDVAALVFGDPLLASRGEAFTALAVAAVAAAAVALTYREQVYIGLSREQASLTGIRLWVYDLVFFTLLGLVVSMLIPVAGFVLEHVLVLLPGALAALAPSSREALLSAAVASLLSGGLGLWLAVLLNISPAGSTGLVLFLLYLTALHRARRR